MDKENVLSINKKEYSQSYFKKKKKKKEENFVFWRNTNEPGGLLLSQTQKQKYHLSHLLYVDSEIIAHRSRG